MKPLLLIGAALLALAGAAEAQPIPIQQFPPDGDPELIRPGPRGEEGEPIEPQRPWAHPWTDDEVVAPPPAKPGEEPDDDDEE